jgi:hypothetical protein
VIAPSDVDAITASLADPNQFAVRFDRHAPSSSLSVGWAVTGPRTCWVRRSSSRSRRGPRTTGARQCSPVAVWDRHQPRRQTPPQPSPAPNGPRHRCPQARRRVPRRRVGRARRRLVAMVVAAVHQLPAAQFNVLFSTCPRNCPTRTSRWCWPSWWAPSVPDSAAHARAGATHPNSRRPGRLLAARPTNSSDERPVDAVRDIRPDPLERRLDHDHTP